MLTTLALKLCPPRCFTINRSGPFYNGGVNIWDNGFITKFLGGEAILLIFIVCWDWWGWTFGAGPVNNNGYIFIHPSVAMQPWNPLAAPCACHWHMHNCATWRCCTAWVFTPQCATHPTTAGVDSHSNLRYMYWAEARITMYVQTIRGSPDLQWPSLSNIAPINASLTVFRFAYYSTHFDLDLLPA